MWKHARLKAVEEETDLTMRSRGVPEEQGWKGAAMDPEQQIEAMEAGEKAGGKAQRPRLKGFGYLYQRGTIWWIRYGFAGAIFASRAVASMKKRPKNY